MAAPDDFLTAQKNGVIAINAYTEAANFHAGKQSSSEISTTTVLKTSAGWVAMVSVILAGSTPGYIYDTNTASNLTGMRIYQIPNVAGIYPVMMPIDVGLVVVPGNGQVVAMGFS